VGVNPWLIAGASLAIAVLFAFVVRKAVLARSRPAFVGPEALVGSLGEARDRLDPAGTVFVTGALWRAVAAGGAIPAGSTVRVVGRTGNELSVESARAEPHRDHPAT
jgi:membrane-bound serine protease (ClpP class)